MFKQNSLAYARLFPFLVYQVQPPRKRHTPMKTNANEPMIQNNVLRKRMLSADFFHMAGKCATAAAISMVVRCSMSNL